MIASAGLCSSRQRLGMYGTMLAAIQAMYAAAPASIRVGGRSGPILLPGKEYEKGVLPPCLAYLLMASISAAFIIIFNIIPQQGVAV